MFDKSYVLAIIIAMFISFIFAYPIIKFLRKKGIGQNILEFVTMHNEKSGTPTMGGVVFLISIVLTYLVLRNASSGLADMCIIVMLAFALLGFLDDFIKVKFKRNLGLTATQKILGQGGIALIISIFCYVSPLCNNVLIVPFSLQVIDVGIFIIPIVFFILIAMTNSVNLTDGLDGLASSVSSVFSVAIGIILCIFGGIVYQSGDTIQSISELSNLILLCFIIFGALLGFLVFNSNKAKIFMGDIGSLSLGAILSTICVFSGIYCYIPFIGIMFVVSAISVILQVLYFKKTKKRLFLMAPLHHHFEKKGYNESKIVYAYTFISIFASFICIYLTM